MISKNDIFKSIRHEANVCKHLYGKLPEGCMEYRPTTGQRSTIELLRYLAVVGIAGTRSMIEHDWSIWGTYKSRADQMTPEDFPEVMDQQMDELEAYLDTISDEDFETKTLKLPTGQELPIDIGLMNSIVKWLTAYKMQLFLYTKANGRDDIGTVNCWAGIDMPPRQKPAPAAEEAAV
jgi:hypothetical protein